MRDEENTNIKSGIRNKLKGHKKKKKSMGEMGVKSWVYWGKKTEDGRGSEAVKTRKL